MQNPERPIKPPLLERVIQALDKHIKIPKDADPDTSHHPTFRASETWARWLDSEYGPLDNI